MHNPCLFYSLLYPLCSPTSSCSFISISLPSTPPPPVPPPAVTTSYLCQSVLEEIAGQEAELSRLRESAHRLWEGQAAGKGFVHRVSQLSAQYLALSNLTKVTTCNPLSFRVV